MKKLISLSAVAAMAAFAAYLPSGAARAQLVCGPGTTPNPAGSGGPVPCIPISDNSGSNSSGPGGHWATRWGAFASDTKSGAIGVATGLASKGKAEKAAIADCRGKGGSDCRTLLAYYNQCAAVAWGDGALQASSAARKEEAEERALGLCARNGKSCEIFFSECSFAELVP
ncbi:DUF4189 domain-containing protein [[Pseudomonas] boreopolis]|uniref:DUF4189 domain-containing protein n=1 Tax=Xanthomonas boreopolis TaxID=86183 RepID=UPI003D9B2DD7